LNRCHRLQAGALHHSFWGRSPVYSSGASELAQGNSCGRAARPTDRQLLSICYTRRMSRLADDFPAIDADDMLRPLQNPKPVGITWPDGEQSTFNVALTFTPSNFNGERVWFRCPRCRTRCRKLYADCINRVLGCRHCLRLRYRSQQPRKPLPPHMAFFRDAMADLYQPRQKVKA
jgi:hypothetical protein